MWRCQWLRRYVRWNELSWVFYCQLYNNSLLVAQSNCSAVNENVLSGDQCVYFSGTVHTDSARHCIIWYHPVSQLSLCLPGQQQLSLATARPSRRQHATDGKSIVTLSWYLLNALRNLVRMYKYIAYTVCGNVHYYSYCFYYCSVVHGFYYGGKHWCGWHLCGRQYPSNKSVRWLHFRYTVCCIPAHICQ